MAKKLWGGRFEKKTDPLVEDFTRSIQYDYKLAPYDILGSIIHVEVLKRAHYLNAAEAASLQRGLKAVAAKLKKNPASPAHQPLEDIHTFIQNQLEKEAGAVSLKLQTCRSRNDQVVLGMKLYCRNQAAMLEKDILGLMEAFMAKGAEYDGLILPGFTHLQHAQPVYAGDYLSAYARMLKRDYARIHSAVEHIEFSFGAGALAGTPVQARHYHVAVKDYAAGLSFASLEDLSVTLKPTANSLDTVSDRDFVIEIVSALSLTAMHLSRLAEDLIIWTTKEFGFIELDDAYCTGSSLMPQKKNPDVLELIRGYAGRLYGHLVGVLTMMKGLPLAYNRDMQLDKEPLFDSFEIVSLELRVLAGLIKTLKFNTDKIESHLKDESLYATDIVYYLVDKKVPFKEAHSIVGRLVKYSLDNEIPIQDLPEDKLKEFSPVFVRGEIVKLFNPVVSVKSRKSVKRDR